MNRSGVALVYVLFALLIVEGMTAGLCALALQARAAATSRAARIRVSADDEYLVASAIGDAQRMSLDSIAIGSSRTSGKLRIERLSEGMFLVTAGSSAAVARFLDRQRFLEDAFGVVAVDSTIVIGGVRWDEIRKIVEADSTSIYAAHDTVLNKDGAGLLIVDGALELRAAHFTGVIIARRGLTLTNGSSVTGGVLAFGVAWAPATPGFEFSATDIVRIESETPSALRQILAQRRYIPTFH